MVGIITSQPLLTGVNARDGSRVQLTLGDPSYAANYFFISIMIMWATQRPRKRWARYLAYAIFVVAMAFTGSNSGVVSLAVGILVAGVVGVWRRAGIAPAVATLALLLASGVLIAKNVSLAQIQTEAQGSKISFIRDGLGRGTSVNQRGMLLGESLKLYTDGSIFGEGPASTKVRLIDSGAQFAKQAHDDYLGALTERGFIGFAGVLLLAVTVFLRAAGAAVSRLRDGYAAVLARPNALLGAVLGTLVAATVYGLFHNRHVWTLFAIAAAASFWGRGHK
jgi:O-antigen ligase